MSRTMFYFCYIVCLITCGCYGSVTQCGVSELKGILGQPLAFGNTALDSESESLALQRTNKNSRKNLLVYSRNSEKNKSLTDGRYRYNERESCFEILKLQREDQGTYEITVIHDSTETFCKYDLKVYEKITNVMVKVNHSYQNDYCRVTMECVPQTGDNVTFSWTQDQRDLHYNDSTLTVTILKDYATSTYACRAQNPVSNASSVIKLTEICSEASVISVNHYDLKYLAIGLLVLIPIVVAAILIVHSRKKGKVHIQQQNSPESTLSPNPSVETGVAFSTVYAAVQKKESASMKVVPSTHMRQVVTTEYDMVQRKQREDNITTVYQLAGPSRADL